MVEDLNGRWKALSALARFALVAGLAALALGTAAAAWWALRSEQQVLFSGLSPQDAAAVVKELDRQKVAYRLADGGGTVLVAEDEVHRTRLKLMGSGGVALQGTVGFEMFNNADFGMTDFAQRINYQRAMQGELARTILSLSEVATARVHLVLPEGGLYRKGQTRPKASVTLKLKAPLQASQVLGIQRLVAASVPEMEPELVTVVDQQGQTLSRTEAGDEGGAGARVEAKQQVEGYVRKKVVEVLDGALGPGRAIVTVDVVLNTDRVQYTREEVLPYATVNGVPTGATVKRRENVQSVGGAATEEARAAARTGKAAEAAAPAESSGHTVEVEYANGRKVEQVVLGSGHIRRLSVGVLLPSDVPADSLPKLRHMVTMAVGLSDARGDALLVDTIARPRALTPEPAQVPVQAAATAEPVGRHGPASPEAGLPGLLAMPMLLWLGAAAAALLAAGLAVAGSRRAGSNVPRLSAEQRTALLEDVRRWTEEGALPAPAQRS